MSKSIVGLLAGQFLVALGCVIAFADDEPQPPAAAPPAKKDVVIDAAVIDTAVVDAAVEVDSKDARKISGEKAVGQADASQVDAKKPADEKAKPAKKAPAPAGYEDAPQAKAGPPNVAAARIVFQAMEVAEDADDLAAGFDQLLAAKVDANVANIEKQFVPQFTLLLTSELSFIHRACDLNLEQRLQIKAASDRCLAGAIRKYAMTQQGMVRRRAGQPQVPDPTDLLHQALAKVLEETLRPEQRAAYDAEMAKREAYRRQVAVECVVAIIDEMLVLTTDQRQQLLESLNKHWQPQWVQSIEMLINNNRNLPNIPEQFVVPFLDETQQRVWKSTQKQSYAVFGNFGMGQQVGAVDDFPLTETGADAKPKTSD